MTRTLWPIAFCISLAAACSGGGGDDDDGATIDAGATDAMAVETGVITGTILTASIDGEPTVAPGVAVDVLGTDLSVTTDSSGFFSLEAPVGITHLVASKAEHWGNIFTVEHDTTPLTDVEFEVIPSTIVADIDGQVAGTIDAQKGVIFFQFNTEYDGGGEAADVPASTGAFTFDSNGDVAEGPTLQAGGEDFVLHYGVPLGTSTVTVEGASGVNTCSVDHASVANWPVQAQTFTNVQVTCTPL